MRYLLLYFLLASCMPLPVSAQELTAPSVPDSGTQWMPQDTGNLLDGLLELIGNVLSSLRPDLAEATRTASVLLCIVTVFTLLQTLPGSHKRAAAAASAVSVATALLSSTDSLIRLGASTVTTISEYGKLLLPVMTAALAAQGGTTASAALYAGTAAFDLLLTNLISGLLVPGVYLFLVLAVANSALAENILKRLQDFLKWFISWSLKILLTVFTTYMSISGAISGTTDAVALKATKFTISTFVPVVGGILSDASEAILVSASLMKNTAGIYGIFAVLSVFLSPFLTIAIHYAVLKLTAALCTLFGSRQLSDLVEDFSVAMGFLLAMSGAACLMVLISTVCFLKGVG